MKTAAAVQVFEDQLRWPGAPPICLYENLPAFLDRSEMLQFHDDTNPSTTITLYWRCKVCKHLHYQTADSTMPPRYVREGL